MASGSMRFGFVLFVLGCIAAAAWTPEGEEGKRAADYAAESWQVAVASAFEAELYGSDAAKTRMAAAECASVDTCDPSEVGTAEAVWSRSETTECADAPYRPRDAWSMR
ncbi:MAG: hypothetical protein H6832_04400 [Planctomycetes bacterium]|nr:hypothetical protein [Planctomycetota bacterium]MCB9890380.1 hypothetical protein [Planctomycetota bacterium]MCB9917622.1 hypothetical protein [Planctomycetota bacterium]